MIWDDVYEMAKFYLSQGPEKVEIEEMDDQIVSKESIERLAKQVRVKPYFIVAVGDPTATDYDSTGETTNISVPVEVIVAVSDLSSQRKQLNRARELVTRVRQLLQAKAFESDDASRAIFVWQSDEHLGTSRSLTLYSVLFRVDTTTTI